MQQVASRIFRCIHDQMKPQRRDAFIKQNGLVPPKLT